MDPTDAAGQSWFGYSHYSSTKSETIFVGGANQHWWRRRRQKEIDNVAHGPRGLMKEKAEGRSVSVLHV